MPKAKFGENFKQGAKKSWKDARAAEQGQSGFGWDRYDEGSYIGSTKITTGVADSGKVKGADYIDFDTTFGEGSYEGQNVNKRFFFGNEGQTPAMFTQSLEKVIKWCKCLFPDLKDDITQCATPEAFMELLTSEMENVVVDHKFTIKHTKVEEKNAKTGKPIIDPNTGQPKVAWEGNYIEWGEVLGTADEGAEDPEDEEEDSELEDEEADDAETEEEELEAEDDDDDEEEYLPEKDDWVSHKRKGKRTAEEFQVVSVNKRAKTVNLASEDGTIRVSKVAWDKIEPLED